MHPRDPRGPFAHALMKQQLVRATERLSLESADPLIHLMHWSLSTLGL